MLGWIVDLCPKRRNPARRAGVAERRFCRERQDRDESTGEWRSAGGVVPQKKR